jgi:hypothetical protein
MFIMQGWTLNLWLVSVIVLVEGSHAKSVTYGIKQQTPKTGKSVKYQHVVQSSKINGSEPDLKIVIAECSQATKLQVQKMYQDIGRSWLQILYRGRIHRYLS